MAQSPDATSSLDSLLGPPRNIASTQLFMDILRYFGVFTVLTYLHWYFILVLTWNFLLTFDVEFLYKCFSRGLPTRWLRSAAPAAPSAKSIFLCLVPFWSCFVPVDCAPAPITSGPAPPPTPVQRGWPCSHPWAQWVLLLLLGWSLLLLLQEVDWQNSYKISVDKLQKENHALSPELERKKNLY